MPNGTITTTFLGRPDQQLAFLQLAREVNPDRFSTAYDISRVLLSSATIAPISLEVLSDDSYFKFNIDSINLYTLIHLERSSFGVIYRKAYDILRNHTDDHGNAFFNMIDRALNGPNPARDAETKALLEQWLLRPRRDFPVDLRGKVAACAAVDRACQPIPVPQRINDRLPLAAQPFSDGERRRWSHRNGRYRLHPAVLDGPLLWGRRRYAARRLGREWSACACAGSDRVVDRFGLCFDDRRQPASRYPSRSAA